MLNLFLLASSSSKDSSQTSSFIIFYHFSSPLGNFPYFPAITTSDRELQHRQAAAAADSVMGKLISLSLSRGARKKLFRGCESITIQFLFR